MKIAPVKLISSFLKRNILSRIENVFWYFDKPFKNGQSV